MVLSAGATASSTGSPFEAFGDMSVKIVCLDLFAREKMLQSNEISRLRWTVWFCVRKGGLDHAPCGNDTGDCLRDGKKGM